MLSVDFRKSLDVMVNQFVAASDLDYDIHEPRDLEHIMRRSILSKNPEALEYAIGEMYRLTGYTPGQAVT